MLLIYFLFLYERKVVVSGRPKSFVLLAIKVYFAKHRQA